MEKLNRRQILKGALGGIGVLVADHALGNTCEITPTQPKGPFYPKQKPLDKDADLTVMEGAVAPALGERVLIEGVVTDGLCQPIEGALVEIWQACESGRYNHPIDPNTAPLDPNFQYFAEVKTNKKGEYSFKTIIPGAYPADVGWTRPPHIHWQISKVGYKALVTQTFFDDARFTDLNNNDLILQDLTEPDQKKLLIKFQDSLFVDPWNQPPKGVFNITLKKVRSPFEKR